MAPHNRTRMGSFRCKVWLEAPPGRFDRMFTWAMSRVKRACDNSQFGAVIMKFYDEAGREIGSTTIGTATPELRARVAAEEEEEGSVQSPPVIMSG